VGPARVAASSSPRERIGGIGGRCVRSVAGRCAGVDGRVLASLLVSAALVADSASAQVLARATGDETDGVSLAPMSLSGEASPLSLSWNPAGLALGPGRFAVVAGAGDPSVGARSGAGFFASSGGLVAGAGAAHVLAGGVELTGRTDGCSAARACVRRSSLAYAYGTPAFAFGAALRGYQSDESPSLASLVTLDAGLVWRPQSWLSLGASMWGLPSIRDAVPLKLGAGFTVRPLSPLQLGADLLFADASRDAGDVAGAVTAAWEVVPGLELTGRFVAGRSGSTGLFGLRGAFGHTAATLAMSLPRGSGLPSAVVAVEGGFVPEPTFVPTPRRVHVLDLADALAAPDFVDRLLGRAPALDPWTRVVSRLRSLEGDRSVAALVVKVPEGVGGLGRARIEELLALFDGVRHGGGRVVAYLTGGGDAEYLLATGADRIYALPSSLFAINGLASERTYLRGTLDLLGVVPEFITAGAYKSAPEEFMRTGPSDAAQENTDSILDDVDARYRKAIRNARGVDDAAIRARFAEGLSSAEDLVAARFIDGTCADGMGLAAVVDKVVGEPLEVVTAGRPEEPPRRWGASPALAVVLVEGTLADVAGDATDLVSATVPVAELVSRIDALAEDDEVRAVVVRIDSPGGTVSASERLYAAVKRLSKRKPVVASMGDVAASGGYYVAAAADVIFASPGTITGSIGVFAGKVDLSALLAKAGVTRHVTRRGERADLETLSRAWTEGERAAMQDSVDAMYEAFLLRVAEGRKLSRAEVHAVAQGRVWTGAQALERKLVDRLGGLDEAVAEAAKRAGIEASDPPVLVGGGALWGPAAGVNAVRVAISSGERASGLGGLVARALSGDATALLRLVSTDPVASALVSGRPLALAAPPRLDGP